MTKEQLRTYRELKLEADQVHELLLEFEAGLYAPSTSKLDGMPHAAPQPGSAIERGAEKHIALQELYRSKREVLAEAVLVIEQTIDALPSLERTVCRYYYIKGLTWEQVCVKINYSWSQVHRIHARALRLLESK